MGGAGRAAALGMAVLLHAPGGWSQPATASVSAAATSSSASSPAAGASAGAPAAGTEASLCRELWPEGKARPAWVETFPERGLAGHVVTLELELTHGVGETVLPDGLQLEYAGDQLQVLEAAGFVIPDPRGGAAPVVARATAAGEAKTRVELPFVPLPETAGRHQLTLPSLPIAIARASGELMTLCTAPHRIQIEDPTANEADAAPRANPPPQRQLEAWTALRNAVMAAAVALPLGLLLGWLAVLWWRRPRPQAPPTPPRPPWEVAFEALDEIRHSGLVSAGRYSEHFDRVSHALRRYVGDRYGFDGLENTTYETLGELGRVSLAAGALAEIERFLREADLVKFAKLTPTGEQCEAALSAAERIVHTTRPSPAEAESAVAGERSPDAASPREGGRRARSERARRGGRRRS